jgi:hypothetical protein
MLNKNNIEEIFKSGLENLESPVPTDVWTGIETNLPASGGASATTGIAKSLLTKVAIGVISVGAISYGVYHFTNSTGSSNESITEVTTVSENDLNILEESSSEENNTLPNNSDNPNFTAEATEKAGETEKSSDTKTYPKNHINKPNTYIPTSTENNTSNNNSGEKNDNNISANDNNKKNETSTNNNPTLEKPKEIETPLAVEIIANETEGKIPFEVSLKLDKQVNHVIWTLPGGKEISSAELNHTFEKLGKHTVKVKATDSKGKTAINEITVNVLPTAFIKLPKPVGNSGVRQFYANGNNTFNIEFENVAEVDGAIWDLKGNEVYKFNTIEGAKWDGKNMIGNICEPGVYFMLIKATGFDGYPSKPERISINLTR